MSPVSLTRYRVTFLDGDLYEIIVEAMNEALAIKKARRIYNLNGAGEVDGCPVNWTAEPLVQEVQS